jgi:quercetin dioxygenase-like cupin family protein
MSGTKEVSKVWGKEVWVVNTELYCGKLLTLYQGKRCSVHHHNNKDETFYILRGQVLMETWKSNQFEERVMNAKEVIRILPKTKHRFSGLEDSVIIEISTHHEDKDSYREELSGDVPLEIMRKYNLK